MRPIPIDAMDLAHEIQMRRAVNPWARDSHVLTDLAANVAVRLIPEGDDRDAFLAACEVAR